LTTISQISSPTNKDFKHAAKFARNWLLFHLLARDTVGGGALVLAPICACIRSYTTIAYFVGLPPKIVTVSTRHTEILLQNF
jgi:hypothetical protein